MTLANLDVASHDGILIVSVAGEIDLSNADDIRDQVVEAIGTAHDRVALDLTGTTYLDSTGVRLLFDLATRMQARRRKLALVVTDRAIVRRVIVLTKLDEAVPVHASLGEAVAELSRSESAGPV